MIIYIEYVLIDNFIIDYYLLSAAFALTGIKVKRGRLFLSALLGATTAIILPFISQNNLILVPLKVLIGVLMVALSYNFSSFRGVYIHFIIFFLYTAVVGGVMIALFNLFNIDYSKEIFSATMLFPVSVVIKYLSKAINALYRKRDQIAYSVNVMLYKDQLKVKARGFFDTGNGAYHNDSPVIFCTKKLIKPFLDNPLKLNPFYLKVETVSGSDKKFAFNLDKIEIYYGDKLNIFNNVALCVIDSGVDGLYDIILHPALMEKDNENSNVQTQKVS